MQGVHVFMLTVVAAGTGGDRTITQVQGELWKEVGTKEHTHACPHPSPPAPPLTPPHPTVPSLPHFPCRQASAICVGHGNLLFVSSGRNNFVLEDLNVLDFMVGVDTQVCRAHKWGTRGLETEWLRPLPSIRARCGLK